MESVILSEDNIEQYSGYIPEDIAENIGRVYYNGIIVKVAEQPVAGMIWVLRNYKKKGEPTSHIEWLVVSDKEAGNLLFSEYSRLLEDEDVVKSDFSLPARTSKVERAILKEHGFTSALMEGDTISARLSEISDLGFITKIEPSEDIKALYDIPQRGLNTVLKRMVSKGHFGICEDIELLSRMHFDNNVSCFSEQDGVVNGLFLCHLTASGKLLVEMMTYIGKDYVKGLLQMIRFALINADYYYSGDMEVVIDRHNYASLALGEKFLPRSFGIPVYVGSREERSA